MKVIFPALFVAACLNIHAAPPLVVTSDLEGRLRPCADCPAATGYPGLARIAAGVSALRDRHSDLLFVDAGNALMGSDSTASRGALAAELLMRIQPDVLNISHRDFRFGAERLLEVLAESGLPAVSANVRAVDESRLFEPFRTVRGTTVIGLTERPAGMAFLPHLRKQLERVEILDPREALREVAPQISGSGPVVVLYYGGARGAGDVAETAAELFAGRSVRMALSGGAAGAVFEGVEMIPADASGKLLTVSGGMQPIEVSGLEQDPGMAAVLSDRLKPAADEPGGAAADSERIDFSAERTVLPAPVRGSNRGFSAAVFGVNRPADFGGQSPATGAQWLVLDVQIENDQAIDLLLELDYEEALLLGPLHRQLFVIVNGIHARPAARPEGDVAGLFPNTSRLLRAGDGVRGRIAFEVPEGEVHSLSLHYYHDLFPPLRVDIGGDAARKETDARHHGVSENQMAVWVTGMERKNEVDGLAAPEGMDWLAVDLLGQGMRMDEIDALAVQRGADLNEKVGNARVTEYLRADGLIQLVVDGGDVYVRDERVSVLPMNPSFLPDVKTGGRMVFPVPRDAEVFELALDFPEYRGAAGARFPDSIRFVLEGDPETLRAPEALAHIEDDPLPLEILSARWRENPVSLEVEAQIRNVSDTGGMYHGVRRARLRMPDQSILNATATRLRGGLSTPSEMWLPPGGEPRRIWFMFEPEETARRVDFHYNGVTSGGTVPLDFENGTVSASEVEVADAEAGEEREGLARVTDEGEAASPGVRKEEYRPPPNRTPVDFPLSTLAADPEAEPPEHPIALKLTAQNERIEVEMPHAFLFETIHGSAVEDDKLMLGVHMRVQRRGDTDAGRDEQYVQRNWEQTVFAVDGRGYLIPAERVRRDPLSMSGGIRLQRTGEPEEGLLYFPIPAENLGHVELLWIDAEFGHMRFPVFPVGESVPEPEPVLAGTNPVASLQIHGFGPAESFAGRDAREDHWLVLDLRGRTLRPPMGNHVDSEPLFPRGWRDRLFLVLDGRHMFSVPLRGSDLPENWMWMPQRHTGGRVAFSLPEGAWESAQSAELIFGFGPHTAGPGERLRVPDLIRIPLKGTPPQPVRPEEILAEDSDADLKMRITGFDQPKLVPGSRSASIWFTVDFELEALRPEGLTVDPVHRFQLRSANGNAYRLAYLFWGEKSQHPSRGDQSRWLPPGVSLPLRMVWRVPSEEQADLRLLHAGVWTYAMHPIGPQTDDADSAGFDPAFSGHGIRLWDHGLEPKGIEGVGLTPEEVNGAIDRGREFLWERLQSNYVRRDRLSGRRFMIISIYALVNVEAHKIYPEFDAMLREYLHRVNPNDLQVYEIGLLAMIIRAYGDPEFHGKLEQVSRWLVEAQGEGGTWYYSADVPDHFFPSLALEKPEAAGPFRIEGGEPPPEKDERDPDAEMHRTISFRRGQDGDNSTTQFAVLGLWSIARAGLKLDPDIWERTLMRATLNQSLDGGDDLGGFTYRGMARSTYGAMTAAGLSTIALAMRHLDAEADVRHHPRMLNALGWLANQFSVSDHPGRTGYNYYYLYSLERVGQILGTEFIGEYEWYPLGARHLVDTQSADGSWPTRSGESSTALTTAYALLFLIRATPAMDEEIVPEPEPEGPGRLVTTFAQPADSADLYVIFDASGSMRAEVDGVSKFDLARQALIDLVAGLPDNSQLALRVFGHRFHALHARADEDTELIIPRGPLDRERFAQMMARLRPRGKTPLALTLEEAARDLRGHRGGMPVQVIMFTDGAEDTREDPVEAARNFASTAGNIEFTMLGFNIQNPVWLRQLNDIASTAGGLYVNVEDPRQLLRELEAVIHPPPPGFILTDAGGNRVAGGVFGGEVEGLEPGEYHLRSELPGETLETSFWVRPGRETRIHFDWQEALKPQ